jgi:hypothetical protein
MLDAGNWILEAEILRCAKNDNSPAASSRANQVAVPAIAKQDAAVPVCDALRRGKLAAAKRELRGVWVLSRRAGDR